MTIKRKLKLIKICFVAWVSLMVVGLASKWFSAQYGVNKWALRLDSGNIYFDRIPANNPLQFESGFTLTAKQARLKWIRPQYRALPSGAVVVVFPLWIPFIGLSAVIVALTKSLRRGAIVLKPGQPLPENIVGFPCPKCEYPLVKKTSGVCPECGTPIVVPPMFRRMAKAIDKGTPGNS